MADEEFGSTLWKNVQAVKIESGNIAYYLKVRANGRDGIVIGADQVAASEAATTSGPDGITTKRSRRWIARLTRR